MDPAKSALTDAAQASITLTRREADFAALMDLTRSLASRDDIFDILFSVVSRLTKLLGVDRGSIVLRDPGDLPGEEEARGIVVASSDDESLRSLRVPLEKYPEIQQVLDSGEALIIRDVKESPILTEVIKVEGTLAFSSMALIPISGDDAPLAVLCLKSGARADFSDYDVMHAQAVADATAIALSNARTLRELRDEARALFSAHTRDEKKLKELSRYLEIFESSRDAMLVMDRSGRVLFANPMAAELTHRSISELVGADLVELLAEEENDFVEEIVRGFSSSQYPAGIDFSIRSPAAHRSRTGVEKRTIACVNFSGVLGESEAVLAAMRDVTAERSMARELAQTKEFLERVIESSVDGIVSADLRGNVLLYNSAAARLFGYAQDEVIGTITVDKLYPEGVARDIMSRIKGIEGGGVGRLEEHRTDMLSKSGDPVPVNLSASLIMDGESPVGTVGIFTDIREKLAMEASLSTAQRQLQDRQRNDAIAEVAGAAAHELNQPLTSVMGYAEFLKRAVAEDPQLCHAVDVILSESQRMADIVRKVGRITRYETKPYVGAAKIVDIDRSSAPENQNSDEREN